MADTIITPSNSMSSTLVDSDSSGSLFITEGGYIFSRNSDGYRGFGQTYDITIEGSIISRSGYAISLLSSASDATINGYNTITVSSTGVLKGFVGIYAAGSGNFVENYGLIAASLPSSYGMFLNGDATVINRGTIEASLGISVSEGNLSLNNSGEIYSSNTSLFCAGSLKLTNTGIIDGTIQSNGGSILTNYGIIDGNIITSVSASSLSLVDVIDTSLGSINGLVNLGAGADTYTGGVSTDRVVGGLDNDTIDLGGGDDVYRAGNGDGRDVLDGGDGIDRYDASDATQAVTVDLSSNTTAGTVGADDIINFENVTGGSAADTLTGDDGANRIDGGMGADILSGGAGNDRLIGGTGTDTITGGAGKDILTGGQITGGLDSDTFVLRTGDSGVTAATRDTISDFTDHGRATGTFNTGADLIDLHLIDASTTASGDQAFSFNTVKGAAFSGAAGSLIWQQFTGFALVSGDTNGDGKADFTIQLNGTHTLFASDFVL